MDIILVDQEDREIGSKNIDDVDWANDVYRVAGVLLRNGNGNILIAQRSLNKIHSPGAWGPSAAGVVEPGESYVDNVVKETQEEIGLTLHPDQLVLGPKVLTHRNDPLRSYFMQWFLADCDASIEDMQLQEEEVASVRWIAPDALRREMQTSPEQFVDITPEIFDHLSA